MLAAWRLAVALLLIVALAALSAACTADPSPPTPPPSPSVSEPIGPTPSPDPHPPSPLPASPSPQLGTPSPEPSSNADIDWRRGSDDSDFSVADVIAGVVAVGGGVVAVGSFDDETALFGGAAAWRSVDGIRWQRAPGVPRVRNAAMEGVTSGPAGLVAVGWRTDGDASWPSVWVSPDGLDWLIVDDADLVRGQMTAVAANALGYVALGFDPDTDEGLVWSSRDGREWTAAMVVPEFEIQPSINDVVALGEGFIAYGSTAADERAALWTSFDGRAWQRVLGLPTSPSSTINSVTASGTRLVAVGASYLDEGTLALAWASDDGLDWLAVVDQDEGVAGEMVGVVPVRSGFLAVGSIEGTEREDLVGAVWWSDDGLAWQREPDVPHFARARLADVVRAGPGLVVIGEVAEDEAFEDFRPAVWLGQPH